MAGLLQSELLRCCMINHFSAEEKVAHFLLPHWNLEGLDCIVALGFSDSTGVE